MTFRIQHHTTMKAYSRAIDSIESVTFILWNLINTWFSNQPYSLEASSLIIGVQLKPFQLEETFNYTTICSMYGRNSVKILYFVLGVFWYFKVRRSFYAGFDLGWNWCFCVSAILCLSTFMQIRYFSPWVEYKSSVKTQRGEHEMK